MELRDLAVAIVTSEEARERDRLAIESGTPSGLLMHNAGVAAAKRIMHHFRRELADGLEVHTGPGNNGGDGWIVAREIAGQGISVRVTEAEPARTGDAVQARDSARSIQFSELHSSPGVVVDALLGTGSRGQPEGRIRSAISAINDARATGAKVVSLDMPTGVNADSGAAHGPVTADLTLAFGSAKRGHLISRGLCGLVEVLDIGLSRFGTPSQRDVALASGDWVAAHIPPIAPNSHKGARKRLAIVAGDVGMAGAAILAGRGALRSGIGLLHMVVAPENRDVVHTSIPAALVSTFDDFLSDPASLLSAADSLVLGPGMQPQTAAAILTSIPQSIRFIVLDAGALTALGQGNRALKDLCAGRDLVITPHAAEMGRLVGSTTSEVLERRFEVGLELAGETGATVLLKGTPTIISHMNRGRIASATGTAALATGGSGDVLSGMIGTLIAQGENGFDSAVCSAWVHGRAAELCGAVRGVTLDDVLFAMPAAWKISPAMLQPPVLAALPLV